MASLAASKHGELPGLLPLPEACDLAVALLSEAVGTNLAGEETNLDAPAGAAAMAVTAVADTASAGVEKEPPVSIMWRAADSPMLHAQAVLCADAKLPHTTFGKYGINAGGWLIACEQTSPISGAASIARAEECTGVPSPEMVFYENAIVLYHIQSGCKLTFDATSALSCVSGRRSDVKVANSKGWDARPAHQRVDEHGKPIEVLDVDFDWTYLTDFCGRLRSVPVPTPASNEHESASPAISIPTAKLASRGKILWHASVQLYASELDDNGLVDATVRVRVMDDFFFLLFRCWLRVDRVLVRSHEVRVYSEFGSDVIIREQVLKENSYAELAAKGLSVVGTGNYRSPDYVARHLGIVSSSSDTIHLHSHIS